MKKTFTFLNYLTLVCFITSCITKTDNSLEKNISTSSYSSSNSNDEKDEEGEEKSDNSAGCKFEDGSYSATVVYNNSETGYSATYTLDVDVQDCQVIQINFPNNGYLDEDHITFADIDEDGNASVDGEDGKTYEIHIDE